MAGPGVFDTGDPSGICAIRSHQCEEGGKESAMKKRSHAYIALRALKLIDDETKDSSSAWRRQARKLAELLFFYLPEVYEAAWLPDSVIVDLSTGHIFKMGATAEETGIADVAEDQRFKATYSTLKRRLVGNRLSLEAAKGASVLRDPYRSNPDLGGELPNRVLALSHGIGDQLKLSDYPLDFYVKPARKRGFAKAAKTAGGMSGVRVDTLSLAPTYSARQIAMSCFILSHYVVDAHMPIHCDIREYRHPTLGMSFDDRFHHRLEKEWEDQVPEESALQTMESRSLDECLDTLPVGSVFSQLGVGPYSLSLVRLKRGEWEEMVDVCRVSFALSRKWIPDGAATVADIRGHRTPEHTPAEDFESLTLSIFHDAVEAVARIWLKSWLRYAS
jgi:hypothetical protein